MKVVDTEQWKLSIIPEYIPKNPDTKESCTACHGHGYKYFEELRCEECSGNGFYYTRNTTEPKPELPIGLVEALRKAYKEWRDDV